MKNKSKGFTLIELLATILLVSIVFSISTYFVINTINTSKEKANKTTLNGIKKSANLYIEEYPENIIWNDNSTCVYIGDLVEYGYLKETQIKGFDTYLILNKNENNTIIKEQLDTEGICKDNKSGIRIPTSKECIKNLIYQPNKEQTLITSRNNDEYEVINATGTNAGEYHITAKIKKENTTWKDGTTEDKIVTCTIKKATPTLSITPKESSEVVGAKTEIKLTSSIPGTLAIKSTNQDFAKGSLESNIIEKEKELKATIESLATRDVPTYINITLTPNDNKNYNNITTTYTIKNINKGKVLIPTKEEYCKDITYNGNKQKLVKDPGNGFTFKNTEGKEVGTYTITAQLNYGYIWQDKDGKIIDTKDKTFTCKINEPPVKKYTITLDKGNCINEGTTSITATENSSTISPTTITRAKATYTVDGFELDAKRNSDGATVSSTNPIISTSYANKYYTTKEGNTQILNVTSDGTPSWVNTTIANYLKEGKWIGTTNKTIYAKCNSNSVTLPEITKPNHTCGWTTIQSGTTIDFPSKAKLHLSLDLTLYGICIKNAPTSTPTTTPTTTPTATNYTVEFRSNNTDCPINYDNGKETYGTQWSVNHPTCTGYTFTGWTASTSLKTNDALYGSSKADTKWTNENTRVKGIWSFTYFNNLVNAGETVTLYANWTKNETPTTTPTTTTTTTPTENYTVKFRSNNTSACPINYDDGTEMYGAQWSVNHPTCTGYTFTGWTASTSLNTNIALYGSSKADTKWNNENTKVKGTKSYTTFKNLVNAGRTVTLYANWTKNETTTTTQSYTVKFASSNETCSKPYSETTHIYNTTYNILNPSCTGYTFTGWTASGNFNKTTALISSSPTEEMTQWNGTKTKAKYFKNLSNTGGTVTMTANWQPNKYYITYRLQKNINELSKGEGIGSPYAGCDNNPTTVEYGKEFSVCTPKNSNDYYFFGGWEITSTKDIDGYYRYYKINNTLSSDVKITSSSQHIGDGAYDKMLLKNLTTTNGATITLTASWRKKNWYVRNTDNTGTGMYQDGHAMYTGLLSTAISAAADGSTIDLKQNKEEQAQADEQVTIPKNITLNLESGASYNFLNSSGNVVLSINSEKYVKITGSGTLQTDTGNKNFKMGTMISTAGALKIIDSKIIHNGTFTNKQLDYKNGIALYIVSGNTFLQNARIENNANVPTIYRNNGGTYTSMNSTITNRYNSNLRTNL